MISLCLVFTSVIGLCVGSFINALQYRIETGQTMRGRSFCPKCKKQISWYDNIPLLSFIILGGKCRNCQKHISWQYPIVELVTGLVFVGFFYSSGLSAKLADFIVRGSVTNRELISLPLAAISLTAVIAVTILIALHDYKTGYILSAYAYVGMVFAVIYNLAIYGGKLNLGAFSYLYSFVLAAIIPALFFWGLSYFSKEKWMGAGDYEVALLLGFFLGFPLVMPAYYFAFIVGSVVGIVLVYISKTKKLGSAIPLGPLLIAGMVFAFIFGQYFVDLYARIILGI